MKSAAFSKTLRLRKRREFLRVQRAGTKVHTRSFLVLVAPQEPDRRGPSRLGITVTRKVASAVGRNTIKRRVREAFRRHRHLLPEGFDIVFVAKRTESLPTFADAEHAMRKVARILAREASSSVCRGEEAGRP